MSRWEVLLTRSLEFLLAMALLAIAAIVVCQVLLSFAFHSSITGANEIVTKLFAYTTAIGAAVEIGRREHIAITAVVEAMPKRGQAWADRFSLIAVGLFNAALCAYSLRWIAATGHYTMPTTQLPQAAAQAAIPLGCGLATLYSVLRLCPNGNEAATHEPDQPSEAD